MSRVLWIDLERNGTRLMTYGAVTKAGRTTLRVELEVTDPYELAHLLHSLAEAQEPPRPAKRAPGMLALPPPLRRLE